MIICNLKNKTPCSNSTTSLHSTFVIVVSIWCSSGHTLNAKVWGTLLVVGVGLLGILVLNFVDLSGLAYGVSHFYLINHCHSCHFISSMNNNYVWVLQSTNRSVVFLEALEALWQHKVKPTINTKDEYKRQELTIKLWVGYIVVL